MAAINPNTKRPNQNSCFIAMSGFGKSQALKNVLPRRGVRAVFWDPDNDHPGQHYADKKAFVAALIAACKSGQGFRIAWDGVVDVATFEWWCEVVWNILDGNKITYIGIEELADVSETAGKASFWWGQLNRKCRKYGGILMWTSQRSQEVSKTAYSQAAVKYIGYPNDGANVKALADMVQVNESDLKALKPLEFYRREWVNTEKIQFKYIEN
jgi:hypothetical protein